MSDESMVLKLEVKPDESNIIPGIEDDFKPIFLALWFSDNPPIDEENDDACIGYAVYDENKCELDGGEMDYNSEKENYKNISDAVKDIIYFAFGNAEIRNCETTNLNPEDFD